MVASAATMTLTFGGRRVGEIGPAPRCEALVTATATVTGTTGVAAPTGNVTLAIASHSSLLDPFPHTLDLPPVRRGSHAQLCTGFLGKAQEAASLAGHVHPHRNVLLATAFSRVHSKCGWPPV